MKLFALVCTIQGFFLNDLALPYTVTPKIHHNLPDTTFHIQWKINISKNKSFLNLG